MNLTPRGWMRTWRGLTLPRGREHACIWIYPPPLLARMRGGGEADYWAVQPPTHTGGCGCTNGLRLPELEGFALRCFLSLMSNGAL